MRAQTLNFNLTPVTAKVYDFLKHRILVGKFQPGSFLPAARSSMKSVKGETFVSVALTRCIRPLCASTPMCAFIPKCHWLPLRV